MKKLLVIPAILLLLNLGGCVVVPARGYYAPSRVVVEPVVEYRGDWHHDHGDWHHDHDHWR